MSDALDSVAGQLNAAALDLALLTNDPLASCDKALEAEPRNPRATAFRTYLDCYEQTSAARARATQRLQAFGSPEGITDPGDRAHLEAATAWADGRLYDALACFDQALLADPQDLLALKVGQDVAFFLGDHRQVRDIVGRVQGAWEPTRTEWGLAQGMYAFGLEEMGEYRRAEQAASAAMAACPADVWAAHAMAHVLEMTGRAGEGAAFLKGSAPDWSPSYFAVHNWWHLALYLLEMGDVDGAVRLYDDKVGGGHSWMWLDMVDVSSLLWRLDLLGVDVQARAKAATEPFEARIEENLYVFNDLHSVCIFSLAGRGDLVDRVLTATDKPSDGDNERVLAAVGRRLLAGFAAFSRKDWGGAVEHLSRSLSWTYQIGGSHAQRDLVDQTLLVAAVRAGDQAAERALVSQRAAQQHWSSQSIAALVAAAAG